MKKQVQQDKYTGMIILNENKKVFRMCDVEVNEGELLINMYNPISC